MLAPPPAPWVALLFPAVALVYVAVGLGAWLRRPSSRLGFLLVVGGGCVLLGGLANVGSVALAAVATVTATLILAVITQLLLSFPTGRLRDRGSRIVVAAGWFVCIVLQAPLYLFAPAGPLSLADRHDLAQIGSPGAARRRRLRRRRGRVAVRAADRRSLPRAAPRAAAVDRLRPLRAAADPGQQRALRPLRAGRAPHWRPSS